MVYGTGLENRRARKGTGGSNPSPSANCLFRGVEMLETGRAGSKRDALGATFGRQLESGASEEWAFLSSHHPQGQRIGMPDDGGRAIDGAPVGDGRNGNVASLGDGDGEAGG